MTSIKLSSEVKLTKAQAEVVKMMREGARLTRLYNDMNSWELVANDYRRTVENNDIRDISMTSIIEYEGTRNNRHVYKLTDLGRTIEL